jgi:hypothetical protein
MSEFPKRRLLKLDKTSVEGRVASGECRGSSDTETRNLKPWVQMSGVRFQVSDCGVSRVKRVEKSNQLSVNSNSILDRSLFKSE